MNSAHRELIEQRAAQGHAASQLLLSVKRRREAGVSRQMTVAEVAARITERRAAGFVSHGARIHSALNPCEDCR